MDEKRLIEKINELDDSAQIYTFADQADSVIEICTAAELKAAVGEAVDMLLYCPNCFEQHVDDPKPGICETCGGDEPNCACSEFKAWLNPPHKSHRCESCNHVWRPADVPTNGVQSLRTKGERDKSARPIAFANGKDFNDAVSLAAPPAREWVATADRLPEVEGKYWWTERTSGRVLTMQFAWDDDDQREMYVRDCTAWMEVPEVFVPQPFTGGAN